MKHPPTKAQLHTPTHDDDGKNRGMMVLVRTIVGVLVLAAVMGIARGLVATRPAPEKKPAQESAFSVRAIEAPQFVVAQRFDGFGTVRAMAESDVAAELSGRVVSRPDEIEEGAHVTMGDLIVGIEAREYEQRLISAQQRVLGFEADADAIVLERASLERQIELAAEETELARNDYNREVNARELGAKNDADVEAALASLNRNDRTLTAMKLQLDRLEPRTRSLDAQIASGNADIEIAQQNVERTQIRAPISGTLQRVSARIGEKLRADDPVARIVDTSRVEVPVRLPMSASSLVRAGDEIRVTAGAWTGSFVQSTWDATISRVAPEADTGSRTIIAFVVIEQPASHAADARPDAPTLLPGQFVQAVVTTSSSQRRVVIPRAAIDDEHVFVADADGVIARRRVRVAFGVDAHDVPQLFEHIAESDTSITQWAVLDRGVERGDRVIISNLAQMVEGARVSVSIGSELYPAATSSEETPTQTHDTDTAGTKAGTKTNGGTP